MTLVKFLLFALLVRFTAATPVENTDEPIDDDALVERTLRDRDGRFHPDHGHRRGQHNHATSISHSGPEGVGSLINVNGFELSSFNPGNQNQGFGSRFPPPPQPPPSLPPVPPPTSGTSMPGPNGYANCGCVPYCAPEVLIGMPALLQTLRNDVRCGHRYTLCCLDDPWAGPIDQWVDQMPCQAEEECVRKYGDDPYDIQNFGVIGPCLGLGSVRCLDDRPPPTIIIPIIEQPPLPPPVYIPPPVTEPPTIPPVYVPPPGTEPPTLPPVYIPPPVTEPPTLPPTVYEPPPVTEPPTLPPTVYEPPVDTYQPPEPVVTYEPPEPVVTYEPPEPVVTYEPPEPVVTYEPPEPVVTYEPPEPVVTYEPPEPVVTYEPPEPVVTYEPPEETYVPPVETYEPPTPTYGIPAGGTGVATYPYRRYPNYFGGGGYSRYGSPYGGYGGAGYGGYPYSGYGFRKRFHFSKGFYG